MANFFSRILCDISQGQFDNEFIATLRLADGQRVSLFVDRDLVEKKDDREWLKVTRMGSDTVNDDEEVVLLPTEALESGSRWARVPKQQLIPA